MSLYAGSIQPIQAAQTEMFNCDLQQWALKEDLAGLELPLFALGTQPSVTMREFRAGKRYVRIFPSVCGAATQFDKDLLLFAASQLIEAKNQGQPVSRCLRIRSTDFLLACGRGDGRQSFEAIADMLRRLSSTTIETNVATNGVSQTRGFTIIESYEILTEQSRVAARRGKSGPADGQAEITRVLEFSITLSDWFFNALMANEVLTLNRAYFDLRSPIYRRLYELARKHCGDQPMWKINIDLLAEKVGSTRERFKFRNELRKALQDDKLPEYHLALDRFAKPDDVVFYTRDTGRLAKELQRTNAFTWFERLERPGAARANAAKVSNIPAGPHMSSPSGVHRPSPTGHHSLSLRLSSSSAA